MAAVCNYSRRTWELDDSRHSCSVAVRLTQTDIPEAEDPGGERNCVEMHFQISGLSLH